MKVGADTLRATAEKFGFGQRSFHDLDDALTRQALSRFPEDPDEPQTALSAIGQFDVAATPLQMAMVGSGIANDGVVMKPYLVDELRSPKLDVFEKTEPEEMPDQPAISSSAAKDLTDMMVSVVDNGTAKTAAIPGVEVAGKTGTAQSSPDRPPYAWFVSFAPAETPGRRPTRLQGPARAESTAKTRRSPGRGARWRRGPLERKLESARNRPKAVPAAPVRVGGVDSSLHKAGPVLGPQTAAARCARPLRPAARAAGRQSG
jgi:hypothetical protein